MKALESLVQRWSGPTGILVLFGAVVWGVQLNIATLSLVEEVASIRDNHHTLEREVMTLTSETLRLAATVNTAVRTMDSLERRMTRNEAWIVDNKAHTKDGHGE